VTPRVRSTSDPARIPLVVLIGMAIALGASCVAAWFCPRDALTADIAT